MFTFWEWEMKFEDDKSKATKELDALSEATKKTLLEEQELVRTRPDEDAPELLCEHPR